MPVIGPTLNSLSQLWPRARLNRTEYFICWFKQYKETMTKSCKGVLVIQEKEQQVRKIGKQPKEKEIFGEEKRKRKGETHLNF